MPDEPAIACRLTAPDLAQRLATIRQGLVARAAHIERLDNGYRLGLRNSTDEVEAVLEFVRFEQQCCPFLTFTVHVPPEPGTVTLDVSGPPESQPLLASMLTRSPIVKDPHP